MCPQSESLAMYIDDLDMQNPSLNKFIVTGLITLKENFTGGLKLYMDVTRCSLDLSHCEQYDRVVIPNLCDKINDKSSVWAPMTKAIRPRMKCPLKTGSYVVNNGTFDLNLVSRLPIEGYRWIVKNRIVHGPKKSERLVFCCELDVSITVKKRARR